MDDELCVIHHLLPFHYAKYREAELPQSILKPLTPQAAFLVPKLIAVFHARPSKCAINRVSFVKYVVVVFSLQILWCHVKHVMSPSESLSVAGASFFLETPFCLPSDLTLELYANSLFWT